MLTCEHAGHRIPRQYARLFAGAGDVLASHRGWDPGALALARLLARRLDVPLLSTTWSRLLVEANRSADRPAVWSRFTAGLAAAERERIVARYWRPHRDAVERMVRHAIARRGAVVHIAVHSFTPVLDGEVRNADVGFLYDSRQRAESVLARRWKRGLVASLPDVRVRLNYPYLGRSDGLTTALRKRFPASRYRGIELEVNQALLAWPGWRSVGAVLADTIGGVTHVR